MFALEFEQVSFAWRELSPVERNDRPEFCVGLFAASPGIDLRNRQLNCFADVGLFGITRAIEDQGALMSLFADPLGKADLPCQGKRILILHPEESQEIVVVPGGL